MMPPYRKQNPLAAALGGNESISERPALPLPRFLTLKSNELPSDIKPGQSISFEVYGVIKSMNDEGDVTIAVLQIQQEENEPDESDEPIRVITQESHG